METVTPITNLSDTQLLEALCSTSDDAPIYELFIKRFLPEIQKECLQICEKRKIDPHVGKQIAHETFERVRKYKSFKTDQVRMPNSRKAIHVYLMRIVVRQFNNYHTKEKKEDLVHKTYFEDIFDPGELDLNAQELKDIKDKTMLAFSKLNTKEKKIILTDLDYKRSHKYLPDDVVNTLAEQLQVKKDTIRKIRERAQQKLKKAINEINSN